ncbi:hypothetical protein B0E53_00186 [Micromonospora sp. MH33]|nr:hypothetical protein B0E53_00186 [Micromonospora sp. MH33]
MKITRLVTPEDAPALAEVLRCGDPAAQVRSQRVLERNGFVQFGMAPEYLNIAGRWQDHAMYQVVKRSSATG